VALQQANSISGRGLRSLAKAASIKVVYEVGAGKGCVLRRPEAKGRRLEAAIQASRRLRQAPLKFGASCQLHPHITPLPYFAKECQPAFLPEPNHARIHRSRFNSLIERTPKPRQRKGPRASRP